MSRPSYPETDSSQSSSTNLHLVGPGGSHFSFNSTRQLLEDEETRSFIPAYMPRPLSTTNSLYSAAGRPESSQVASLSTKFSLTPDLRTYTTAAEDDDFLHAPEPKKYGSNLGDIASVRGFANLGGLIIILLGLLTLFVGYPIISYFTEQSLSRQGGFNIGGTNASGQIPEMAGSRGVIDSDTPAEAYTKISIETGEEMQLVFSDEFNVDGRSFYPGDDPYWTAEDYHYCELAGYDLLTTRGTDAFRTNNLEWYDPKQVTTQGGNLVITLDEKPSHNMDYTGGLLNSWNKFCFTGGYLEAEVMLPGDTEARGLWPALWTMGNLGRAAYGATLEGMWPYSYDSCDVGTVANQTRDGLPVAATVGGSGGMGASENALSYLPGQRLSRWYVMNGHLTCTHISSCPGSSHPGPMHSDGSFVGRAAPEIDVFEAQVGEGVGHVSMSGQWGPFNADYAWFNSTEENFHAYDEDIAHLNEYRGGVFQQTTSAVVTTNQDCYQHEKGCQAIYGIEYKPGFDDAYIIWVNDGKPAWRLGAGGVAADPKVEIGARPIPTEPMYMIINLGISPNFGAIDYDLLQWPAIMTVNYIRVYQPKGAINIGCDPKGYPTKAYIDEYMEAYTNPNLTTWIDDFKATVSMAIVKGRGASLE